MRRRKSFEALTEVVPGVLVEGCTQAAAGRTIGFVASSVVRWLWLVLMAGVAWLGMRAAPLHAAASEAVRENYTTRLWQTQNGLPEQTVQAFAQTPDGFLWIGTTGGLLRFDGSRFVTFDRGNTPAFRENSVFCLTAGRDGTLWIGTEGGGLVRLRDGVFRQFGKAEGLLDGFVRKVLEDREGRIWVGTDNGLFRLTDGGMEPVSRIDGTAQIPAIAVHGMTETADGRVWAGGSKLIALQNGRAREYPLAGQYGETRVKSILQTRDGAIWVGTVSGLHRMLPGEASFDRVAGIQGTVRALAETDSAEKSGGTLWIGTIGQGAYRIRAGHLEEVGAGKPETPNLPSRTVLSLFEDSERNVWMGTQAGMLRFSRSPVELVSLPDASDSDFETVSLDRDDSLWVASTRLSHIVRGVATPIDFRELHGARVRNVFRSHDGALWIGTDGQGLFRLKPGHPAAQYTTANGLVNNFIRGILEARNGDLWVATDEGVSRLSNSGTLRNFTVQDGLAYFSVRVLLEDRAGGIWIGTDRGLSHLAGERFQKDAATAAMADEKVWAAAQTSSGTLWFGTRDAGLYRYVPGQGATAHFTTEQGLASNSVYSILEDHRARFWMSGANGVQVLSIADLELPRRDQRQYLAKRFFSVSEGGELTPLYGGRQPAGAMTEEGEAWFPTSKGAIHLLAGDTKLSAAPQVFLDQVTADGRALAIERGPIELAAGNRNIEISYGSILLGPQDAVQFQYKLEPFDRDWRYGSNRRVADYTNLPAGAYTFRVRAFEGASGRSTERTLEIMKQQYFFLTWWFLGLCLAALALAVWWLHWQRVRRVEVAFQAVIEERARLAREMHDTLIQGCAGVSLLLEACSVEASGGTGQSELLDCARTQLAASIDEARQAVWDLRGQESTDFAGILRKMVGRLDRGSNVEVECQVEGEEYSFHPQTTHEIAMASREAIYNALLHANPTRIEVQASYGETDFALTVKDNGSGFESTTHAPEGHYGLVGIEERIRRLGGSVKVKTALTRGTSVSMRIPRSALCETPALTKKTAMVLDENMEESVR